MAPFNSLWLLHTSPHDSLAGGSNTLEKVFQVFMAPYHQPPTFPLSHFWELGDQAERRGRGVVSLASSYLCVSNFCWLWLIFFLCSQYFSIRQFHSLNSRQELSVRCTILIKDLSFQFQIGLCIEGKVLAGIQTI